MYLLRAVGIVALSKGHDSLVFVKVVVAVNNINARIQLACASFLSFFFASKKHSMERPMPYHLPPFHSSFVQPFPLNNNDQVLSCPCPF